MVGDGIKAARIQARSSPLIGCTWKPVCFPGNIRSAVKNRANRLNPFRGSRRPAGRHATPGRRTAPGRSLIGRHAAR